MPSENAPAPEKPVVMAQVGRQLTQWPISALGQWRFSTGLPFSTSRMCFLLPRRSSSTAVKMPAGPAPTMMRSYFSITLFILYVELIKPLSLANARQGRVAAPSIRCALRASCWPLPQQRLPVSATGGGRRCCPCRGEPLAKRSVLRCFMRSAAERQGLSSIEEVASRSDDGEVIPPPAPPRRSHPHSRAPQRWTPHLRGRHLGR